MVEQKPQAVRPKVKSRQTGDANRRKKDEHLKSEQLFDDRLDLIEKRVSLILKYLPEIDFDNLATSLSDIDRKIPTSITSSVPMPAAKATQPDRSVSIEDETPNDRNLNEIVILTKLLKQAEELASDRLEILEKERKDYDRFIALTIESLLKTPSLAILPATIRNRIMRRRLRRAGIIDAGAYLAMHTDVKAAGADPIEHYLKHGIVEGRRIKPRKED